MTGAEILALVQVVLLDLVLSGDNAVIVGTLAAGLALNLRKKAIVCGVLLAVVLRILMSLCAVWLMQIPAIMVIGGVLLLGVAWKMFKELQAGGGEEEHKEAPTAFWPAMIAIAAADVSMSLDNVLAVAGAAREHPVIMVIGLVLSVILMGVGANLVAKLIDRFKWIAWAGLVLILAVAVRMIVHGWPDIVALVM